MRTLNSTITKCTLSSYGRLQLEKIDPIYSINDQFTGEILYQTNSKENAEWKMEKIYQDDLEQANWNNRHNHTLRTI